MGAGRETASLWFHLFGKYGAFGRCFRSQYFWQDNLFTPFNRLIGCRLFGHGKRQAVNDRGEPPRFICFKCYREVPPRSTLDEALNSGDGSYKP